MKQDLTNADDRAAALLRVASYLGRPQKFMAVADARAEMRRTLEMVAKGSVVLHHARRTRSGCRTFHHSRRDAACSLASAR